MTKEKGILLDVNKADRELLEENPEMFWQGVKVIGAGAFTNSGIEELVVPNTVSEVSSRAFYSCKYLKLIALPQTITKINKNTFQWCWALEKVLLPESIREIDDFAFAGCEKLAEIVLPEGIERIGNKAFEHCHNLTKIYLPASLREGDSAIFNHCGKLKEVYALGNTKFNKTSFQGMSVGTKIFVHEHYPEELEAEFQ